MRWEAGPRHACAQGNVDGAFFGTTFPHLLLMTFPGIRPQRPLERYTPRVFGFKLHQSALTVCDGIASGARGGGGAAATPDGAAPPMVSAQPELPEKMRAGPLPAAQALHRAAWLACTAGRLSWKQPHCNTPWLHAAGCREPH